MPETVADIVKVIFSAEGQEHVARAMEDMASRMGRFEKGTVQTSVAGVRERVRASTQERKEREATYAAMFKQIDAQEKAASKSADKAARERAKSEADAARLRLREEENLAKAKQRILDNSARYAGRVAEQQASAEIRSAERVSRERKRLTDREVADRKRAAGSFTGVVGGGVSRALGTAGMVVGGALAIGGGFSVADALRSDMNAEKSAIGLINSLPNAQGKGMNWRDIVARGKAIQGVTNIDKGEVIESMRSYSAVTGDAGLINDSKSMMQIAKIAKGTGAGMGNLMSFAGLMKAQNKNLDNAGLLDMLRAGTAQGMTGAIEVKDLAAIAGKITASRGAYQTNQTSAQKQLLGLGQIVFPTAGSADEAATVVSRFSQDALHNSAKFKAMGLVDGKGTLADPDKIITKVLEASKGNIGTIMASTDKGGFGFMKESGKLFEQLAPTWREAYEKAGGDKNSAAASKAAGEAITKQITDVTGSTMTEGDVEEKFVRAMDATAEKLDAAMIKLKEILADKGVPIFEKFIQKLGENLPAIEQNIGKLAELVAWFADNPFKGLGALVAVSVGKDLLNAGIGVVVKDTLANILTKGMAGGNPMTFTGAVTMAAGVVTIMAAKQAVDDTLGGQVAGQRRVGEISSEISHLNDLPLEARKKKLAEIQEELEGAKKTGGISIGNYDPVKLGVDAVAGAITGDKKGVFNSHEAVEKGAFSEELITNMDKFAAAIAKANKQFEEGGAGGPTSSADPAHPARRGPPIAQ